MDFNEIIEMDLYILDEEIEKLCSELNDDDRFKLYSIYLHKMAKKLNRFYDENNTDKFIKELKLLDPDYLKNQLSKYSNQGKVNEIRARIIKKLIEDKKNLDLDFFDKTKKEVNEEYDKNILHPWNDFSILFSIFYNKYKKKSKKYLTEIFKIIKGKVNVDNNYFKKSKYICDFLGPQNYGTDRCWIALYPKNIKSHRNAVQLFYDIHSDKIVYGLMPGWDINEKFKGSEDVDKIENIEDLELSKVVNKFNKVSDKFKEINKELMAVKETNYFWLNRSSENYEKLRNNIKVDVKTHTENGNERNIYSDFKKASKNDTVYIYEVSGEKNLKAVAEIIEEIHENSEGEEVITVELKKELENYISLNLIEQETNIDHISKVFHELSDDDVEKIKELIKRKSINYWIFNSNPEKWDVIQALTDNNLYTWGVKQHKKISVKEMNLLYM